MSKLGPVVVLIGCLLAGSAGVQASASPGPDQRVEPWEAEVSRRVIRSSGDTIEHVDPQTVRIAGEVYAVLVERLDAALAQP